MAKCPEKFWPSDRYVEKVLVGNWCENRRKFVKTPHDFKTNYVLDFYKKPSTNIEPFVWDQRYKWRGLDARVLYDHDSPHYLENFSTTYDLGYRHYPTLSDGPIPRVYRFRLERYDPQRDYAKNHGNVTRYGLVERKREQWRCESMDPRLTLTSWYQDYYTSPKHEKKRSWGIPIPNSSAVSPNNRNLYNCRYRNKQILAVPENNLVQVPCKPRCNPITWKCPDPLIEPVRCIGPPIRRKTRNKLYF